MYTIDSVPHLRCADCKFFCVRADMDGVESQCKRIDHKKVRFHKSPFQSYHCGEWHVPCADFEPSHPEYADFQDWTTMEDAWPVFCEAWGYEVRDTLTFHVNGDYDTDYLVPFDLFFRGGMIEDGILKATVKQTCVKDRVEHGVQLYKLKREKINGVVIETGEVL